MSMGWELSIDFTFDRSFYELPAVVFKKRRENIAKNMQTRTPVFNENPQPFSALGEKFDYCVVFFSHFHSRLETISEFDNRHRSKRKCIDTR